MEKICPFCGEKIPQSSTRCMYCGEELKEESIHVVENEKINCPVCGEKINADIRRCPYCGEFLNPKGDSKKKDPISDTLGVAHRSKNNVGLAVALSVLGFLIVVGAGVGLYFALKPDYSEIAAEFLMKNGLSEDDVILQLEGDCPAIYCFDADGSLVKYDLKTQEVVSMTNIECSNRDNAVSFSGRTNVWQYGGDIVIAGYNGWNGAGAGDNVVVYNTYTGKARHLCFGRNVRVVLPFVTALEYDGNYYKFVTYSLDTYQEADMVILTGSIGWYPVVVELAVDQYYKTVVGSYYYKSQGSGKQIYLEGEINERGTIIDVNGYLGIYDGADYSETMSLVVHDDGSLSGKWIDADSGMMEVYLE